MGGRIVVGVDGSPTSRMALRRALAEAERIDGTLDVVMAYREPLPIGMYGAAVPFTMPNAVAEAAQRELDAMVGELRTDVTVNALLIDDHPSTALLDVARNAELLVLGSRGRGSFAGLLLGSTSHEVLGHATCPVLVVPVARPARDPATARADSVATDPLVLDVDVATT